MPQKALYPIGGVPMLSFLFRRLISGLPTEQFKLMLATTQLAQDDILAQWAVEYGIDVVRGEENDLVKRYCRCLDAYPADTVVRVTADNPLTCPRLIIRLVNELKRGQADYAQYSNIPYGAGADVFSADTLRDLDTRAKSPEEREHINLYIIKNCDNYEIVDAKINGELARPDISITVDTQEDWLRVRSLFNQRQIEPWRISLEETIARMDSTVA
jgi:spore coat polysaccharide biosynthesis protein SpsF